MQSFERLSMAILQMDRASVAAHEAAAAAADLLLKAKDLAAAIEELTAARLAYERDIESAVRGVGKRFLPPVIETSAGEPASTQEQPAPLPVGNSDGQPKDSGLKEVGQTTDGAAIGYCKRDGQWIAQTNRNGEIIEQSFKRKMDAVEQCEIWIRDGAPRKKPPVVESSDEEGDFTAALDAAESPAEAPEIPDGAVLTLLPGKEIVRAYPDGKWRSVTTASVGDYIYLRGNESSAAIAFEAGGVKASVLLVHAVVETADGTAIIAFPRPRWKEDLRGSQ